MIRNLKALGLAVVAVFAMSALVASAAQATVTTKTIITPEGNKPTVITAEQTAGLALTEITAGNRAFICSKVHFDGEIAGNTTDVKLTPTLEGCETTPVLGIKLPVTMTHNNCWYTFTGENTIETGKYGVSVHLECQNPGEELITHIKSGGTDVCTITIKPQTITGLYVKNAGTKPDDVVLNWNTAKFNTTIHGTLCGGSSSETNKEFVTEIHGEATVTGLQNDVQVDLTVSHTEVIE
jgi:hypothetical protein